MARLFIPGPTHILPENLNAQTLPMIGHRSEEYPVLHGSIVENLKTLLDTQNDIFILASSSTGCMEAAIRNTVQDRVLCIVNGAFSERWACVAENNGKQVDRLEVEWGTAVTPEMLEKCLNEADYDAVTLVLSETSTGARSPIEALRKVMNKYPKTLFLVDGVSIVAGEPVKIDHWGIDVCLFGTQKALALPPGLGFMSISPSALARAKTVKNRGHYFDFLNLKKYADRNQTPATPPISLMYAAQNQLRRIIEEEGRTQRFLRHVVMAKRVREWGKQYFELFTDSQYLVNTITAFRTPEHFDTAAFIKEARILGYILSNGYGPLKNKTFRIGHMGDHTVEDIEEMLSAIDSIVKKQLTLTPLTHEAAYC